MSRSAGALTRGAYRLLECLGRGGMAEVWRAQTEGPSGFVRTLAIKRILPHLVEHPGVIELFKREATTAALLHHRHIVQVFELVAADGEYLLAMELVDGVDLATLLRGGRLPLGFTLEVGLALARALEHAHSLRGSNGPLLLLHRDVSPANVLVGRDGVIKLSDFGIAKVQAHVSALTQSKVRGKTMYMSPEQGAGERIDRRSDLFSVGVVLYEALAGVRPFDSLLGALTLRGGVRPPPPSAHDPTLPPELDAVVMRLLERDPGDRYASAGELGAALEQLAHAHPWSVVETGRLVEACGRPAVLSSPATPATVTATRRGPALVAVAISCVVIASIAWLLWPRDTPAPPPHAPPPVDTAPPPLPPPRPQPPPMVSPTPTARLVEPAPQRGAPAVKRGSSRKKRPRESLREVEVRDPFAE